MRSYLQDLVTYLPQVIPGATVKLFTPDWSPPFDLPGNNPIEVVKCREVPVSRPGRVWYEQTVLPRLIREQHVDLWLGTCNTLPLRLPCPAALIVQSLQFFTQPKAFPGVRGWYLRKIVPASIRRAAVVITLSSSSRHEVLQRFSVPEKNVRIIPHCLHDIFQPAAAAADDREVVTRVVGEDAPYILCLSALYPYKNHARLIQAFADIHTRFPRHKLLIAGSDTRSWGRRELAEIAAKFGIASRVVFAGRVAQDDLPALYRTAELLAMPSLDETFGLPVMEAMAFGCPVLTSNISSMAEVAGDAAVLVDPLSVDDMAQALATILSSQELRTSLSRRGRLQAALFSRENMIARFGDLLNPLLAAKTL